MTWEWVIYYGKYTYYVLINCIKNCVRRQFIQNYLKIFNILLVLDKNLGSHTSWPLAKLLWIRSSVYFLLTVNMRMVDWTLYCFSLNLSMHFRVGFRSPVTSKTKLYVTTVNNSFQPLPVFCWKEHHLRYCIGFELNIVTQSTKILKGIRGHCPRSSATLGKYEKHTHQDALKLHYQRFFALSVCS